MVGRTVYLIGITKQSLYKSIGESLLTWSELEEVLLDVEVNLNNRPLTYIKDNLKYSVLTPNSMILGRDIKLPDNSPEEEEISDNWKKQQGYVHECQEGAWKRWVHEYLAALRERYNLSQKEKPVKIKIKDVVMTRDEINRGKLKIGIIKNIFMGKGNTIRSIRIRTQKNVIERPIQLMYPMELRCDSKTNTSNTQDDKTLNVNAEEY